MYEVTIIEEPPHILHQLKSSHQLNTNSYLLITSKTVSYRNQFTRLFIAFPIDITNQSIKNKEMSSQVLYRKWRPQTLSEVVGQEHVTKTLLNALKTGKVAHAYLFCGPRGTGKTSTGRILAKAVNCQKGGKGEPCNACSMCQSITEGRAMDVIEIDAASNRGIDEIRELRERVRFSPGEARFKVYIIDEVHMLTDAAANALLKTLEEPPPHAIFILATTETHKVPLTILSRCQRFDFRRIPQAAMTKRLAEVCKSEGIQIEEAALNQIGKVQDAQRLLVPRPLLLELT